ncbi:MAG: peptide ABC transporter substrate-binding protein [Planctomycetota bacterium]
MGKLILTLVLLVAVVSATIVADRPDPPADFTFINRGDVNTLDPQRMSWMQDLLVARMVFEGLTRNDVLSPGFEPVPAAAERWEISDDQREYTFTIREDALWSNGSPVTAGDFVYSWRRAMLPDIASDYFKFFMLIDGARPFYDWRTAELDKLAKGESEYADGDELWAATEAKFRELVALEARGDKTLWMRLVRPQPFWLDLCSFAVLSPVYPPLVSQYERPDPRTGSLDRRGGWTKPPKLVTNGPFELVRWRFKRDMRFERSETYWDRDSIDIGSILIPSVEEPNAQILAYQTGAAQFVANVAAGYRGDMVADKLAFYDDHREEYERLKALGHDQFTIDRMLPQDPRAHTHAVPSFGTYFWNFNCRPTLPDGRPNPFADKRVRKAFSLVVDKQAITDEVRRVGEPVARSLIPPGSIAGYTPPAGLPDVGTASNEAEKQAIIEQALALMADAGYPNPAEDFPVTVELVFNKDAGHDLVAQVFARNWEEHLGVDTLLAQKELKVYRNDLKEGNFMVSRAGWYGDYADPTTFLDLSRTGNGNNDRAFSDPAYDAMLDAAGDELDPEKRLAILAEAERLMIEEEMPLFPIFYYNTVYMFDAHELTGLTTHPQTKQNIHVFDVMADGIGRDEWKPMRMGPFSDRVEALLFGHHLGMGGGRP